MNGLGSLVCVLKILSLFSPLFGDYKSLSPLVYDSASDHFPKTGSYFEERLSELLGNFFRCHGFIKNVQQCPGSCRYSSVLIDTPHRNPSFQRRLVEVRKLTIQDFQQKSNMGKQ
ncbi:hypothetical cytosolic protein [Syntrophus aciditrophicus SB]|uniref:Hypothetical cytosolic protein n=1 Tax=Syntrophus aciditrophicus (strain SB) TaxID=56780 RepID=Q2LTU6_SYNAS|nr:hypothetical cytosolic protein [Syntrophus aciditrophicus SB]